MPQHHLLPPDLAAPTFLTPGVTVPAPACAPPAPAIPQSVVELLRHAAAALRNAAAEPAAQDRYIGAHLAALRAAAAMLAARAAPGRASSRPRSVWVALPRVAPGLSEWAAFFAASATVRAALEAGLRGVTCRQADDLVRDAETFLVAVAQALRLPHQTVLV